MIVPTFFVSQKVGTMTVPVFFASQNGGTTTVPVFFVSRKRGTVAVPPFWLCPARAAGPSSTPCAMLFSAHAQKVAPPQMILWIGTVAVLLVKLWRLSDTSRESGNVTSVQHPEKGPDHKLPDPQEATRVYLGYLVNAYQYLDLRGMGITDRMALKVPRRPTSRSTPACIPPRARPGRADPPPSRCLCQRAGRPRRIARPLHRLLLRGGTRHPGSPG